MYKRILLPVDGSHCSNAGVQEVARIAAETPHDVCVFHVVEAPGWSEVFPSGSVASVMSGAFLDAGRKVLTDAAEILAQHGISSEQILAESHHQRASRLIVHYAQRWQADLIVMGTHGRRGFERLVLGSDAADVVRGAPTPVLLVRDCMEQ